MSWSLEQMVGATIAVIMAGMPAVIALLKIRELHFAVNSQLTAFIAATKMESDNRLAAAKQQSDHHIADLQKELEALRQRNEQLLDQVAELMKRLHDKAVVCNAEAFQCNAEAFQCNAEAFQCNAK